MEQGMRESDAEGLATHGGPESCAGAREDVGEALTGGVQAGLRSREISRSGVPTPLLGAEGHIEDDVKREPSEDPARSENQGMYASSMGENRESPSPPAPRSGAGRSGKAEAASPR
jgi:RNA-directed DNA polymerase